MTIAAQVDTSVHAEAVPATADQNNHVHGATGGISTATVNQKKQKKRMIMKKNPETFMNDKLHGITMTDDIVTRLRAKYLGQLPIVLEAADEIERLREWKELAYQMRNKYWWAMRWKTLKKFDAMHKEDWELPKNVELRKQLKKDWGK